MFFPVPGEGEEASAMHNGGGSFPRASLSRAPGLRPASWPLAALTKARQMFRHILNTLASLKYGLTFREKFYAGLSRHNVSRNEWVR